MNPLFSTELYPHTVLDETLKKTVSNLRHSSALFDIFHRMDAVSCKRSIHRTGQNGERYIYLITSFCPVYFLGYPAVKAWPFSSFTGISRERSGDYPTSDPGATFRSTVTTLREPSAFTAERIMPWLSMPFSLRGARLAMKHTCLPTSSSGL